MQIDNFEEAQALTVQLEKTLPFQIRPGKEFLKMMRDQGKSISSEAICAQRAKNVKVAKVTTA